MLNPETIQQWLQQGFPDGEIEVEGDGQHFQARIVSKDFIGLSLLQRQRKVYQILGANMQQIHALSMQTLTPQQ